MLHLKPKVIVIALLLLITTFAHSQTEIDTTYATQINAIFANLEKNRVPYGILRDYGMEFTNLDNFNGTAPLADSNYTGATTFWDVYKSLFMSAINNSATGLLLPDTVSNRWSAVRQAGTITLAGLFFNYSQFINNASPNYITVSNNKLYDKYVNGVWQNPYQNIKAFVLSPSITSYNSKSFQLLLPANLWLTNSGSTVSSISVDVGDGLGYKTITPGTPINVAYTDTGTKEWKYKLLLTNNTVLYAHSSVYISNTAITGGKLTGRTMGAPQQVTADDPYLGVYGTGIMTISYASTDGKLHNPLIVAEGYDPGNILKPEISTGLSSLSDFISSIDVSRSSNLISLLGTNGSTYDIVYVDWKNGTDYLQRNAYVLEKVIKEVNRQKAIDGITTPNVVLGQSMGGVIARYALKDMENKGIRHQTRLFISHDAPQQGANVPEGFQHLARHARNLSVRTPLTTYVIQLFTPGVNFLRVLSIADEPASKQMLINYFNGNNVLDNTVHNAWQTELKNLGYPTGDGVVPFRKVAISNGSECATLQPFVAGANLLTFQGKANTRFLGDFAGIAILPAAGFILDEPYLLFGAVVGRNDFNFDIQTFAQADGISNQVYKGKITYTKKVIWLIPLTFTLTNKSYNSSASTLPYDNFPGGFYAVPIDLQSTDNKNVLTKYNITAYNQPSFNFIPTPSALDIGLNATTLTKSDYLVKYVGATPPSPPKNTPFQNFVTAFDGGSNDEQHISFETRNGDWLANELNGVNTTANCSFMCSSNMSITGSSPICTSPVTYTLNNAPVGSGISIVWSASVSGLVTITPSANGTQATVSRSGTGQTGQLILSATVSGQSCGSVTINSSTIRVGGFSSSDYPVSGPSSACRNTYVTYSTNALPGATGYTWFYPGSGTWTYVSGQNTNSITLITGSATGNYQVGVRVANACDAGGSYAIANTFVNACGGFAVEASPNPTDGELTVITTDASASSLKTGVVTASTNKIYKIKIADQLGNIRKTFSFQGVTTAKMNISSLHSGVYMLSVYNGKEWSSKKIILQK